MYYSTIDLNKDFLVKSSGFLSALLAAVINSFSVIIANTSSSLAFNNLTRYLIVPFEVWIRFNLPGTKSNEVYLILLTILTISFPVKR